MTVRTIIGRRGDDQRLVGAGAAIVEVAAVSVVQTITSLPVLPVWSSNPPLPDRLVTARSWVTLAPETPSVTVSAVPSTVRVRVSLEKVPCRAASGGA